MATVAKAATTKQELVNGLRFLIDEGRRIGGAMDEAGWAKVQDGDGWKNKEVLAHVAAIGTIVVPFMSSVANAAPETDNAAGTDVDALNAQLVGARVGKSVAELCDEIEQAYAGVIAFVEAQSEDFLAQRRTVGGYVDVPVGDLLNRIVVLHGLSHIYSAYAATFWR